MRVASSVGGKAARTGTATNISVSVPFTSSATDAITSVTALARFQDGHRRGENPSAPEDRRRTCNPGKSIVEFGLFGF
jgi:hypothetical protein